MEYKNIIFDFDGTLVDTAALIVETMQRTISTLNLPAKTASECRSMIGYRLDDIPKILWPELPDIATLYVKTYREIFNQLKESFRVELYPKVYKTLSLLNNRGVRMAIASSRSKASIMEYTDDLGISSYFEALVGGEDVKEGKPSPEPVNTILSLLKWERDKTLVVGDVNVDIMMGNRAGADTCGLIYGNGTVEELKEADANYIISDFSDLLSIVDTSL